MNYHFLYTFHIHSILFSYHLISLIINNLLDLYSHSIILLINIILVLYHQGDLNLMSLLNDFLLYILAILLLIYLMLHHLLILLLAFFILVNLLSLIISSIMSSLSLNFLSFSPNFSIHLLSIYHYYLFHEILSIISIIFNHSSLLYLSPLLETLLMIFLSSLIIQYSHSIIHS